MPARNHAASTGGSSKPNTNDAPPYWKVLDPIDGGYGYGKTIKARDGHEFDEYEINVYNDLAPRGQRREAIQVQVRKTGKFGATAVITLESVEKFAELVSDMQAALASMQSAPARSRRTPRKAA